MLFKAHLQIADCVLAELKVSWLQRMAFKLGSVAPDLNCLLPSHSLAVIMKRIRRKERKLKRSTAGVLNWFRAGLVCHYICDAFCAVHNGANGRTVHGWQHTAYELQLNRDLQKAQVALRRGIFNTSVERLTDDYWTGIDALHKKYERLEATNTIQDIAFAVGGCQYFVRQFILYQPMSLRASVA